MPQIRLFYTINKKIYCQERSLFLLVGDAQMTQDAWIKTFWSLLYPRVSAAFEWWLFAGDRTPV
ncbi:hypothetical protein [Microcoleus sp. bin38.metabat.b11b12b14.051]|uniref:hypothetical protein n=1 Tax=Microcoleus sp. bin38.metabat.b11b12b14.051 TaxID=2742709 RepID=UPI0025CF2E79|nr:hypothetical protein [Microcoleus sp. bin38.metabat.b11b12b14.051]